MSVQQMKANKCSVGVKDLLSSCSLLAKQRRHRRNTERERKKKGGESKKKNKPAFPDKPTIDISVCVWGPAVTGGERRRGASTTVILRRLEPPLLSQSVWGHDLRSSSSGNGLGALHTAGGRPCAQTDVYTQGLSKDNILSLFCSAIIGCARF